MSHNYFNKRKAQKIVDIEEAWLEENDLNREDSDALFGFSLLIG